MSLRPVSAKVLSDPSPGFPPVEIEGRLLGDPGLISNVPIEPILAATSNADVLCFAVDLFDIFPAHVMVMLGLCLFALGNYFISRTDANTTFLSLAVLIIVARCGMALIIPSLNSSALRALSFEQLHRGSGTINFIRQLGGSCGVTALVVLIERRTQFHVEAMAATQTAGNSTSLELLSKVRALLAQTGVSENLLGPGALHYLGEIIEAQASARGFHDGFLLIAIVFVLAVIPAWNLGKARKRAGKQLK